jgi:hypothetical protein
MRRRRGRGRRKRRVRCMMMRGWGDRCDISALNKDI